MKWETREIKAYDKGEPSLWAVTGRKDERTLEALEGAHGPYDTKEEADMKLYEIEPDNAFEAAILSGRLSENEDANNFVGNYMYMGFNQFKNIETRKYDV